MKDSDLFANEMAELHKEVGRFVLELLETSRGGVADALVSDISTRMTGKLQAELWQGDRQLLQSLLEELKRVRELQPIPTGARGAIFDAATISSQPQSRFSLPTDQAGELQIHNRSQTGGLLYQGSQPAEQSNSDDEGLISRIPLWAKIAAAAGFVAVMIAIVLVFIAPRLFSGPDAEDNAGQTATVDQSVDPAAAAAGQWQRILNTVEVLPEADRVRAYRALCGAPDADTCQYEARREALAEDESALQLAAQLRVLADCVDTQTGATPAALSLTCVVGPDQ